MQAPRLLFLSVMLLCLSLARCQSATNGSTQNSCPAAGRSLGDCDNAYGQNILQNAATTYICATDGIVYKNLNIAQCVRPANQLRNDCAILRSTNHCQDDCLKSSISGN